MSNLSEEEIIKQFEQRLEEIKKDLKQIEDKAIFLEDINLCRVIRAKDIFMLERYFRFI